MHHTLRQHYQTSIILRKSQQKKNIRLKISGDFEADALEKSSIESGIHAEVSVDGRLQGGFDGSLSTS